MKEESRGHKEAVHAWRNPEDTREQCTHEASRRKGHEWEALTLPPHILCSFSFRGVHFFSLLTRRPPPAGFSSSPKASSTDEPSCFMNLVHAVKTLFEEGWYSSCAALGCLGSSQQAGP